MSQGKSSTRSHLMQRSERLNEDNPLTDVYNREAITVRTELFNQKLHNLYSYNIIVIKL